MKAKRLPLLDRSRRSGGFTLLEVLIAMLVFAIGLLGIAGLQAAGMRFVQGSQFRSVALAQAESMVERMRANPRAVIAGNYHMGSRPSGITKDCDVESCSPSELARYDLVVWEQGSRLDSSGANATVLPKGTGLVCLGEVRAEDWTCGALTNSKPFYTVNLRWEERAIRRDDSGGVDSQTSPSGAVTRTLSLQVMPYVDILADGL